MNEHYLTIGAETDIPFDDVVIGHRAGAADLQLSFLNEAAAPFTLSFTTPAEAATAAVLLASAKANGEDASVADLKGLAQGDLLAAA